MNYYLIGIKGSAMANIAAILKSQGNTVTGVDVAEVFPTDVVLEKNHIVWQTFNKAKLPEDTEVVVYAAAHDGKNNALVQEALKKGLKVIHQAELLGELLEKYPISLAVAGCHGKTTTSSLLAYALIKLNQNPSYMVGTPSFNEFEGSSTTESDYFVIEADEYALHPPEDRTPKFHHLKPTNAIITNIDFDHPDVFEDLADTKNAFEVFMNNVASTNDALSLILCADDENLMDVSRRIKGKSIATYGLSETAQYRVHAIQYRGDTTTFTVSFEDQQIGNFSIKIPGEKNVVNATGVITLLLQLGFAPDEIKAAIEGFTGAKRRFEHIETVNGIELFDDYAHHPSELQSILQAVTSRFPGRPLRLIFQPHTFSRTEALADDFVEAFRGATSTIVLPVFASAREEKKKDAFDNRKLQQVAEELGITTVSSPQTEEEVVEILKKQISHNDIVLMAGAGDIYKLQPAILSMLRSR